MSKPKNAAGHMSHALTCSAEPLTAEQIANWRKVLCGMVGPYALLMSDAKVQQVRDSMQARINEMPNTALSGEERRPINEP